MAFHRKHLANESLKLGPFVLGVLLALAGCAARPLRPRISMGDLKSADAYLEGMASYVMKKHRIPGMAVVVVHEGRVIASNTRGRNALVDEKRVDKQSGFMAGSLTKVFTALAVKRLIRDGVIDPGVDIRKYLPEFSIRSGLNEPGEITVEKLLNHTSGLFIDYYPRFTGGKPVGNRELLRFLRDEYLCFKPGSAVKYSNVGYTLLGIIVERVTGESFDSFVKREVLASLGMNHSTFDLQSGILNVTGHDGGRSNKPMTLMDVGDKAAGGMVTTISDLGNFLRFLSCVSCGGKTGSNLDPHRVIRWIETNADRSVDTFFDTRNLYSAGWHLDRYRFPGVGTVLSSSGNVNGFSSEIAYVPERGLGIAVLSNSSFGWKADIELVSRVLGVYLEATGGPFPRSWKGGYDPIHENEPDEPAAGIYAGFGVMVEVFYRRGRPRIRFRGPAARLQHLGRGLYRAEVSLLVTGLDVSRFTEYDKVRFRFYRNQEGSRFMAMEASYENSIFSIPLHFTEKTRVPKSFLQRIGSWELDTQDGGYADILKLYLPSTKLTLVKKKGRIMLETETWMGKGYLVLEPLTDDLARIAGSGEVIRFTGDKLHFIGLRFKRVRS